MKLKNDFLQSYLHGQNGITHYSHHYFNDTKKIDESLQVTSEPIFISDFNLLSCKLENFILKVL